MYVIIAAACADARISIDRFACAMQATRSPENMSCDVWTMTSSSTCAEMVCSTYSSCLCTIQNVQRYELMFMTHTKKNSIAEICVVSPLRYERECTLITMTGTINTPSSRSLLTWATHATPHFHIAHKRLPATMWLVRQFGAGMVELYSTAGIIRVRYEHFLLLEKVLHCV